MLASNVGIGVLFAAGLVVGMAYEACFGTLLLAIRRYMGSRDKAVIGVDDLLMNFVAFTVGAIPSIEYFLAA